MPSIGNMEGHWNICSAVLAAKCFSKEAGAVLSFSSFEYLGSLTALYDTVCMAQCFPRMHRRHSRVAKVLQRFMFHIICWLLTAFQYFKELQSCSKRKGSTCQNNVTLEKTSPCYIFAAFLCITLIANYFVFLHKMMIFDIIRQSWSP